MLTGRVGLSPIMIGRSATLERLMGVMDAAQVGSSDLPAVVLVAGEAGIGKTRLLREMLESVGDDVTVFSVQAEPGSLGRPHDVARQLAAGHDGDPADEAFRVVAESAAAGRTALLIEDLHWIDADSADFVDRLARHALPTLVVIATYRATELVRGAPGGDLVLRLERRNEVEQIRLDRLVRTEVASLMAAITEQVVSSAAIDAVHRRSGGVPFVVEELMRSAGKDACSDDIVGARLPWSLEEAVRQQLTDLSPEERSIIEALAVFGQPAGFEVLSAITQFDEAALVQHLRGLTARGVIVEPREDRLWFGHALVGDSVAQQLLGRERRLLHQRCFARLRDSHEPDHAALARHAAGAGRFDELPEIARVGATAYLDAGATFQALRLACEGLAEEPTDPTLLSVATRAAWRLDFLPEALGHALDWHRHAEDLEARIHATRYIARLHLEQHDLVACDQVLGDLLALVEELPLGRDKARAEAAASQIMMLLDRDPEAIRLADLAIEHATAVGDDLIVAHALVEKGSALGYSAPRAVGLDALAAALAAARAVGDVVLVSRVLNNSIGLFPPNGVQAREMRAQLRTAATAGGLDKLGSINLLFYEADAAYADADQPAFRRQIDAVAAISPVPNSVAALVGDRAILAMEEGRVAVGRLNAERFHDCRSNKSPDDVLRAEMQIAVLERNEADGRRVLELLLAGDPPADDWLAPGLIVEIVSAALALSVTADELRARLLDGWLAEHPARTLFHSLVEGLFSLEANRSTDAVRELGIALELAADVLAKPITASLHLARAMALHAAGERTLALAEARVSRAVLDRWPGWRRDRDESLIRRLEGSQHRADGVLTPRETEVAELIAEGLTNGQLAERLFISPKTAAVHVSNILAKLGLSSRAEVAAWVVRRQLAPTA